MIHATILELHRGTQRERILFTTGTKEVQKSTEEKQLSLHAAYMLSFRCPEDLAVPFISKQGY